MHKTIGNLIQCCCSCVPARFILVVMGGLAVINAYTMRNVLSIAITQMTFRAAKNVTLTDDTCPSPDYTTLQERSGFVWSEELQGVILGAFYWGYAILHIPGAILSAKYGGKYTLSIGILSTAILTILTPIIVHSGGAYALIVLRVLEGFGEGTTFPALNTLLSAWVPKKERSRCTAIVFGGAQIGNICTHLISGYLIDHFQGWEPPFYFFGILSLIWFIFFEFLCFKDPESHPFISQKEKDYLKRELKQLSRDKTISKTPWLAIISSGPMIALMITQIGHAFGYFTVVTDLPKYMADVLNFNIKENGLYSTLPYVAMWIMSILFGAFSDWLLSKKYLNITNSRKVFTTLSFTMPGIFLVAASFSGCNRMLAVVMFTISMGFMGAYYSGMKANNLDLSPNFAGAIMALTNGIGAIVGIINPYIIGVLTPNRTIKEWRNVFYISAGFLIFTNIVYVLFGSGEVQPFDKPKNSRKLDENIEKDQIDDNEMKSSSKF